MGLHPDDLCEQFSAGELAEQEALYRADPWGELRADWRAASICYWLYRLCCLQTGKHPTEGVKDFLLSFEPPERQTPAALKESIKRMNAMLGGTVRKGKRERPKTTPVKPERKRVERNGDGH